jgi:hypothetical protein
MAYQYANNMHKCEARHHSYIAWRNQARWRKRNIEIRYVNTYANQ